MCEKQDIDAFRSSRRGRKPRGHFRCSRSSLFGRGLASPLASSVYGIPRATNDVDLVANVRQTNVRPLHKALEGDFYVAEELIAEAIRDRSSFNVIHLATMFKVDIFVVKTRPFDESQLARRSRYAISMDPERYAYVATAEDNILAKLEWYRIGGEISERQWNDVQNIIKTQVGRLDLGYMQQWAATLGVADLLERALKDALS